MKRYRLSKRKNQKSFTYSAMKTHKKNLTKFNPRGGIRL